MYRESARNRTHDDDPYIRMSYPDLVEEVGVLFDRNTKRYCACA